VTKKPLLGAIVAIAAVGTYLVTRPGAYKVERSAKVNALVTIVFGEVEDFKKWSSWSAWDRRDPQMKKVYGGPPIGIGSTFAWQGDETVGAGRMTIIENEAPIHIKYRLEMTSPVRATGTMTFDLAPQGPDATVVTWAMEGTRDLKRKLSFPFVRSPQKLGEDFAASLASLKQLSEAKARAEAEAQATTAAKERAEPRVAP
jgi:Polyketide cyclase / dehydrase and lipid transport